MEPDTFEYADGRQVVVPDTWLPLEEPVRQTAVAQARAALLGTPVEVADRIQHYYDPGRNFAGALLTQVEPNPPDDLVAADLLAVSTLSMRIEPTQVRELLLPTSRRRVHVISLLRTIPFGLPITSLDLPDAAVRNAVDHMWELQDALRSLMADQVEDTNTWVFAAKMCARKRPYLFPVRDRVVCRYLAGGATLRRGRGFGNFSIDVQAFAYLLSLDDIARQLKEVRRVLASRRYVLDPSDLRLLDVVLWTAASSSSSAS